MDLPGTTGKKAASSLADFGPVKPSWQATLAVGELKASLRRVGAENTGPIGQVTAGFNLIQAIGIAGKQQLERVRRQDIEERRNRGRASGQRELGVLGQRGDASRTGVTVGIGVAGVGDC